MDYSFCLLTIHITFISNFPPVQLLPGHQPGGLCGVLCLLWWSAYSWSRVSGSVQNQDEEPPGGTVHQEGRPVYRGALRYWDNHCSHHQGGPLKLVYPMCGTKKWISLKMGQNVHKYHTLLPIYSIPPHCLWFCSNLILLPNIWPFWNKIVHDFIPPI